MHTPRSARRTHETPEIVNSCIPKQNLLVRLLHIMLLIINFSIFGNTFIPSTCAIVRKLSDNRPTQEQQIINHNETCMQHASQHLLLKLGSDLDVALFAFNMDTLYKPKYANINLLLPVTMISFMYSPIHFQTTMILLVG